jgi:hypothetical protein
MFFSSFNMHLFPLYERLTIPEFKTRLNNLPRAIISMIRPGPGIRLIALPGGGISIATDAEWNKRIGMMGGGGGGGREWNVETVAELPAIPESGYSIVFWTNADGGTGDNQCWEVYAGQSAWTPCQYYTTLSGVPL